MILSQSVRQAKEYFNEALRKTDYYLNDQELNGRFQGKVATRLGITGRTSKDAFHALCENINPLTGGKLTPRNVQNRTIGYDINFHCPKSVSILHAMAQDTHILDAFTESVDEIMRDIEKDASGRIRKNGTDPKRDENRKTGELLWADFLHQTARPVGLAAPDPHLHCHCFVFNVTWDKVEKQFKAGQFRDIKRDMPFYQARFHKVLSDRLIALGYHIRRTNKSFEIVNVPQAAIDLFSKRTNEIGLIAKEQGITDENELSALGAKTRSKKNKGLTVAQLKKEWRKQIASLDAVIDEDAPIRFATKQALENLSPGQCIDHALDYRFERASVVHDRRILETSFRYAIGNPSVTADEITKQFSKDRRILKVKDGTKVLCTTKEVLKQEKRMVELAMNGIGKLKPLYHFLPPINLSGEQLEAVRHVLTTSSLVSIIQGRAGTGKTTLMTEAVKLIEQTGRQVTVVAPTAQASRGVLRNEGFSGAETVAKLLSSPDLQEALKDGLLWVDEAGLLGTKDMTALLELAKRQNARLILSGDTRQHASVVRGDALRILNIVGGIKAAEVSRIYRQRNTDYREAVQALSEGNLSVGFDRLKAIGAIKALSLKNPYNQLVNDYMAVIDKGRTALVISPTHRQGEAVTKEIRQRLRDCGRIGVDEIIIPQLVNTNMTDAEKSDSRNYKAGFKVQFTQNLKGIERGSVWEIVSILESKIEIEDKGGKKMMLDLANVKKFDVFHQREIALSQNDTLQITRNLYDNKKRRLDNGAVLKFVSIDKVGNLKFCNPVSKVEYTLPKDFGHLAHAYCVTSHASQGKTVDEVFIAQPSSTFSATDLKQFYVSVSRGRDKATIYTDDVQSLLLHAAESGDRQSALELMKRKNDTLKTAEHTARFNQPIDKPIKATTKQNTILPSSGRNDLRPQL